MLDDDESGLQKLSSSEDELAILKNSRFLQGYLSFMKDLIRFRFSTLLAALGESLESFSSMLLFLLLAMEWSFPPSEPQGICSEQSTCRDDTPGFRQIC